MLFNFWRVGFVFTQSYDHSTFLVYCFNLDPNPGSFLFDSGIYLTYTKLLTTYRYLTHDLQRIDTRFVASILNTNSIEKPKPRFEPATVRLLLGIYFVLLQASLSSGEGGIVAFAPPNDEIVYQCGHSDLPGIQKV